jgi:hypothetical protein
MNMNLIAALCMNFCFFTLICINQNL